MKKITTTLALLVMGATVARAQQNVSYNLNSVPIGSSYNTAFGHQSLTSTSGFGNSALGYQALTANTYGAFNTAMAYHALKSNTTGVANAAVGYMSLGSNVSGSYNAGMGMAALSSTTTGNNNAALGVGALYANATGSGNTAVGYSADVAAANLSNATAIGNEAIVNASNAIQLGNGAVTHVYAGTGTTAKLVAGGLQITGGSPTAGYVLTSDATGNATWQAAATGSDWSLLGNAGTVDGTHFLGTTTNVPLSFRVNNQRAGRIETTVNGSTSYGYLSGSAYTGVGARNTSIGVKVLQNNTYGMDNAAVGYQTLASNTSGFNNSALGAEVLYANTSGFNNTACGYGTMNTNTTGSYNTAIGVSALVANVSGSYNSALGFWALYQNTSGADNTAAGTAALQFNSTGYHNAAVGRNSLAANTTGFENAALGSHALFTNQTGSANSALGYYANVNAANLSNSTAVGANAVVNASNKLRLGSATVTVIEGSAPYTFVSDGRFKDQVREEDVKGLEFITRLRPVVYNLDTRKLQEFLTASMPDSLRAQYLRQDFAASTAIRQSGFIAQEVEQAAREVGYDFNGVHVPENEADNYSLAYSQFVVPLVKGMQEQQAMLMQQQAQIDALTQLVASLVEAAADGKSAAAVPPATMPSVEVFPNPNQGQFTLSVQGVDAGVLTVTDLHGKVVQTLPLASGTTAYTVNLTGQPKGLYTVTVVAAGTRVVKKVVVE